MSAVTKCAKWIPSAVVLVMIICNPAVYGYTNQWAVHIDGGPEVAKDVAKDYGFRYLDKIVDGCYHFEHRGVSKRSTDPHHDVQNRLVSDIRVRRAEQQRAKSRTKRDLVVKRTSAVVQAILNDERWSHMWYLNRGHGLDMNVQGAWAEGITGAGIVVTILDDGLEKDHPDLLKNYDPQASYDVNSHDEDPMPRYDLVDSNRHGTRCAGEVAATANNSICAVGVAYGAGVGGVRMLDGDVTDAVEARSLSLNPQHIDIYSASWGPDDDGKTVDGPGELATRAFIEGITKGREGKGSIFVWASGNGGRDHDNCNCDGYTNSIWTLSISSATENGLVPWYSEACSSTLATTYSSGSTGEKQVVTTDLHHHCTSSHTGTSASAPLAAGICALALEANSGLTWRDMQHIVVRTAKPANLRAPDWVTNGVERNVSHSFGYGLMDATAMVKLAKKWRTVPEQHKCEVSAPDVGRTIPPKSQISLPLHVKECSGVNFLEHVQAKVSLTAARRGDLQIQLTSPQGTKSTLLAKRPHDVSKAGFNQWPFMSVHTWGERPHGVWKLEIHNEGRLLGRATLHEWALIFYGTATLPDRTEYALYNPAASNIPRRTYGAPRTTGYSRNTNILAPTTFKGKQPKATAEKSPHVSPPYVVNAAQQPTRKNKSRGQHKNGKSTNRATPRPTIQTLRGLTARGPSAGEPRLYTPKPRGRTTPASNNVAVTPPTTTTTTSKPPQTFRQKVSSPPTVLSQQRGLILMEPLAKTAANKVPAIFQQYPKIQQLYPLYPVYAGARGAGQHTPRAKGLDLLQDEQFDSGNLHLDKATLQEWKLVLYGTETSPDGDELVNQKGGVDLDNVQNNIVDTEGDPWSGSQRVDQASHPEVQRTTTEDQTSGACTQMDGSRCLECRQEWFLFDGGCVGQCPRKTYAISDNNKMKKICAPCHYTCAGCFGPADYECTSCLEDSTPYRSGSLTNCVLTSLTPNLRSTRWFYRMFVLLALNLVIVIALGIYFGVIWYVQKRESADFAYSKVTYSVKDSAKNRDLKALPQDSCLSDSD
ncbi:furin-like protease 1 isoform X3 [Athalia rosae]|uniref:furin-like protease 1 isoform X3 n=1 Tax=Athalia rosae TaxID=37344 RepID=UPI0020346A63|nr:furin-like protease 1 isoform X3 [Athalia rosae]